ncbi:cyclic nucleotide-binding domain-containing protein [Candidatus Fermentibacteria bacterium]|nr:cyclic nucleotide-binding domain-containing protein [Candidatus Fermentibacteria bacterium]
MASVQSDFDIIELDPGQILFREGDPNNGRMFVIRSGELSIIKARNGVEYEVNTASQGDLLGEVSFLAGESRTATVQATTACSLFCLSNESFEKMVLRNPQVGLKVIRRLVATLREFEKRTGWL